MSSATAAAEARELSLAVKPDVGVAAMDAAAGCAELRTVRLLASFDFHMVVVERQ